MEQVTRRFATPPRSLSEDAFVDRFGAVYEHSPWVARDTWRHGLGAAQDSIGGLAMALAATVDAAGEARKLTLIRAHPDLGGRAARDGALTQQSSREQVGAGLGHCSPQELERLETMNSAYREKFGFPFVMAVTGRSLADIVAAFEQRLDNEPVAEQERALAEIHEIARLRLFNLVIY